MRYDINGQNLMRASLGRMRNRAPQALGLPVARGLGYIALRHAQRTRSFRNRTWRLRLSMRLTQIRGVIGRFETGYELVAGGPSAPYARFIELGTRLIAARLFIRDALEYARRRGTVVAQTIGRRSLRELALRSRILR